MKVKDTPSWQERRAALTMDGEIGQEFLRFVEQWAGQAEALMKLQPGDHTPGRALNKTLDVVEACLGRADFLFLGQMLAVLAEHWHYGGAELMDSLTAVERRLVEDVTLAKVALEQQKAKTYAQPDSRTPMPGVQPDHQTSTSQTGAAGA